MEDAFVCPICGNKDPRKVGYRNGKPYCRACLSFRGEAVSDNGNRPRYIRTRLSYSLTEEQTRCSDEIFVNYQLGIDTLVHAVCGSGKTELTFRTISEVLKNGGKVGFCIPRRDVVIEIHERLRSFLPGLAVVAVYGGSTKTLDGDVVCLTSHQLYRYPGYFDLLVMDEIDAFPFKGDDVLLRFFYRSIKGHFVMLSATPSEETIRYFETDNRAVVTLYSRYHRHVLPVPSVNIRMGPFKLACLIMRLRKFKEEKKPVFVFVPTIALSEEVYKLVSPFVRGGDYVNSKREDRGRIIGDLRKGKLSYLVTTAVLERGVTIANLQVIVYDADSAIYDRHALVQIAGRAGRKAAYPNGEVLFISERRTSGIEEAIEDIEHANSDLQKLFQKH